MGGSSAAVLCLLNHDCVCRAMASDVALERTRRFSMAWFAVALSLTTATQLRLGPVGPGELMLLAWLALRVAAMTVQRTLFIPREARPILYFWVGAFTLLLAGWLSKLLVVGIPQRNAAFYDTFAFTFTAVSIVVFILQPDLGARVRTAASYMVPALVLPLSLLLFARVAGVTGMGPLEFSYGIRFTGLSLNPNQAAFAILPMPLAALYFLSQSRTTWQKRWWGGLVALSGMVGVATLSDSLLLAWAACTVVLLVVLFLRMVSVRSGSVLRQGIARVVIPVLVLACAAAILPPAFAIATRSAEELSSSQQGSDRFHIWMNGLRAVQTSPIVGLGPGSHSGHDRPFEGFESHNTYIDWSTSTGLLGILMYLSLLCWAGLRAFRDRSTARLLILLALVVFSTFHYSLRQPSFWFYLMVVTFAPVRTGRDEQARPASGAAIPPPGHLPHPVS